MEIICILALVTLTAWLFYKHGERQGELKGMLAMMQEQQVYRGK
jgi:hypothetical protein